MVAIAQTDESVMVGLLKDQGVPAQLYHTGGSIYVVHIPLTRGWYLWADFGEVAADTWRACLYGPQDEDAQLGSEGEYTLLFRETDRYGRAKIAEDLAGLYRGLGFGPDPHKLVGLSGDKDAWTVLGPLGIAVYAEDHVTLLHAPLNSDGTFDVDDASEVDWARAFSESENDEKQALITLAPVLYRLQTVRRQDVTARTANEEEVALDAIAAVMRRNEWNSDLWDVVSGLVIGAGRKVSDE